LDTLHGLTHALMLKDRGVDGELHLGMLVGVPWIDLELVDGDESLAFARRPRS
jgi:hypothetical protein